MFRQQGVAAPEPVEFDVNSARQVIVGQACIDFREKLVGEAAYMLGIPCSLPGTGDFSSDVCLDLLEREMNLTDSTDLTCFCCSLLGSSVCNFVGCQTGVTCDPYYLDINTSGLESFNIGVDLVHSVVEPTWSAI